MTDQILTISLAPDIVDVTGKVNGVTTIWTPLGNNEWQTVAAVADDGIYYVELEITDSTGLTTEAKVTLYYGIQLVTNRTQADVDRVVTLRKKWMNGTITAEEKNEYLAGMKGAYNATDLNRVGAAMEYIAGKLFDAGYGSDLKVKQDWKMSDVPSETNLRYYLESVNSLRAWFVTKETTPDTPPDMERLTYIEANNIEQILMDLDFLITQMIQSYIYSGDVYVGEV